MKIIAIVEVVYRRVKSVGKYHVLIVVDPKILKILYSPHITFRRCENDALKLYAAHGIAHYFQCGPHALCLPDQFGANHRFLWQTLNHRHTSPPSRTILSRKHAVLERSLNEIKSVLFDNLGTDPVHHQPASRSLFPEVMWFIKVNSDEDMNHCSNQSSLIFKIAPIWDLEESWITMKMI